MMGMLARQINQVCQAFGVRPKVVYRSIANLPGFIKDWITYTRSPGAGDFPVRIKHLHPVLADLGHEAGVTSGHYFHQDLWAARKIYERRPATHVDVGSRIDGFVAHLLTFMPVTVVDIRHLRSSVAGLTFLKSDATNLTELGDGSVESVSSLHAVEHFGLGRYGDAIDPHGWRAGLRSLARVLRRGGRLYLSLPIGVPRVEFNAHRVFAPATILEALADLQLVSFSAVDDAGDLAENVNPENYATALFSCGLFEYTKMT